MTQGLERLLPAGGVAFAAVLAAAAIIRDADSDAYLLGLAGFFLIAFLGALRAALREVEGDTAPLSATAVIGGSVAAVGYVLLAAAYARVAGPTSEDLAEVAPFAFFVSFPQAAVVGAAGTVMATTGIVSSRLGLAGQVLVPLQLAAPLVLLSNSDDYAVGLAVGPFAVWVAVAGVLLLRKPGPLDGQPDTTNGAGRR